MTNLTKLFLKARKEKKFSQGDVSRHLGLTSLQYISNIERGMCELSPKHFKRISKLLSIPIVSMIESCEQDYHSWLLTEIHKGK